MDKIIGYYKLLLLYTGLHLRVTFTTQWTYCKKKCTHLAQKWQMEERFCMSKSVLVVKKYLEKCSRIDCVIFFLQNMWMGPSPSWEASLMVPVLESGPTRSTDCPTPLWGITASLCFHASSHASPANWCSYTCIDCFLGASGLFRNTNKEKSWL